MLSGECVSTLSSSAQSLLQQLRGIARPTPKIDITGAMKLLEVPLLNRSPLINPRIIFPSAVTRVLTWLQEALDRLDKRSAAVEGDGEALIKLAEKAAAKINKELQRYALFS